MKKMSIIVSSILIVFLVTNVVHAGDFIAIGESAPDFTLQTVAGETYTLSSIISDSGKVVLINFFAWN